MEQRRTGHGVLRQLQGFFFGSLAGVLVDLVLFQGLVWIGAPAAAANLLSSAAAIVVTYNLVIRHAFAVGANVRSFAVFVGWYAVSIATFSVLIQVLATSVGVSPIVAKVISLPFSFAVNFLASRLIFRRLVPARASAETQAVDPVRDRRAGTVLLVVSWVTLAAAASLLLFRSALNSDSLFADDLARDLFVQHGSWWDWQLTPAPAIFPDLLLYFAMYFLLPSAALRMAAVSIIQVLLLALAALFAARSIDPRLSRFGQAFIVLGVALVTLCAARSEVWLYFHSTNNHFAALLLALVGTGLVISIARRPRWLPTILLAVAVACAAVSTQVALIAFIAPAGLAVVGGAGFLIWRGAVAPRAVAPAALRILGALVVGYGVAWLATRYLIPQSALGGRLSLTLDGLAASLGWVARSIASMLTAHTAGAIGFVVLVAFALVYLGYRVLRAVGVDRTAATGPAVGVALGTGGSRRRGLVLALALLVVIVPVDLLGSVVSGGVVDPYALRYFQAPLALLLVIVGVLLPDVLPRRTSVTAAAGGATAALLLAAIAVTYPSALSWPRLADERAAGATSAIECVDRLRDEGVQLTRGIAQYWNARVVALRADPVVPVTALDENLSFFDWMTTSGPIVSPERYEDLGDYDFIILGTEEPPPYPSGFYFGMTVEGMDPILPPGGTDHVCDDYTVIRTWSDGELQDTVESTFSYVRGYRGDPGDWTLPASAFPSITGEVVDKTIQVDPESTPEVAMYGVTQTLPPGRYRVAITTDEIERGTSGYLFVLDYTTDSELARADLVAGETTTELEFEITGTEPRQVDMRVQATRGPFTIRWVEFAAMDR